MRALTPELVARAIKLRAAGLSYIAIGNACGITKGVVAGIVFRAGACKRRPAAKPKPEVVVASDRLDRTVPRAPRPPPRLLPPGVLRPGLACSWPMWADDTPRRERAYCGCQTGGPGMSYCLPHWKMAYEPVRTRARV